MTYYLIVAYVWTPVLLVMLDLAALGVPLWLASPIVLPGLLAYMAGLAIRDAIYGPWWMRES